MNLVVVSPSSMPRITLTASGIAAAAVVAGSASTRSTAETVALSGWALAVVFAVEIDARAPRLPDVVVMCGTLVTLTAASIAGRGVGAVVGASLFCLPMLLIHLARPGGLGFGDVKFALLLGVGVGVVAPTLVLPAFVLSAAVHAVLCVAVGARRQLVPFGPALGLGSAVIVATGIWGLP